MCIYIYIYIYIYIPGALDSETGRSAPGPPTKSFPTKGP